MPATQLADALLRAYHADEEISPGVAFRKALDQVGLDYTTESLERIDRLLRQMRRELAPQFGTFVDDPAKRNFLLLLCHYIGTVVARQTLQQAERQLHDDIADALPRLDPLGFPAGIAPSTADVRRDEAPGGVAFPLATIKAILFSGDASCSIAADAALAMRRASWRLTWARLATRSTEREAAHRQARQKAVEDYVLRGVDVARISYLVRTGRAAFGPDARPAPLEWEWGLAEALAALAETQVTDVERARARGQPPPVPVARLAFATRYTAQMIDVFSHLLRRRRGGDAEANSRFRPDEIEYVALGFAAGCESAALRMARILCAAWQPPQAYPDPVRPTARAIFGLLARHLAVPMPPLTPSGRRPALDALLDNDRWLHPDAGALAPLVEAVCAEYEEEAPDAPFRALPVCLVLMFKLRAMRGLANPAVAHPLLAAPLGAWAEPVELGHCLDPLLRSVRERLHRHGYDEDAIEAAATGAAPPRVPSEFARPAQTADLSPLSAVIAPKSEPPRDAPDVAALLPRPMGAAKGRAFRAAGVLRHRMADPWNGMREGLEMRHAGWVALVGFAYAWWAAAAFHASEIRGQGGPGVLGLYFMLAVVFVVTMAVVGVVFGRISKHGGDAIPFFAIVLLAVFLLGYGPPSWTMMILGALVYFVTAFSYKTTGEDDRDLACILWDKTATEIEASAEYLRRFSSPLWDKLDLQRSVPVRIFEGRQGAHSFAVIDMRHTGYGLLFDNGRTAITTIFVVTLPRKFVHPVVTWHPGGYQVSVDGEHVYLAATQKQVRPRDWLERIQLTIKVAQSVEEATAAQAASRPATYRPAGAGVLVYGFWALVCLLVAIAALVGGLAAILGFIPPDKGSPVALLVDALFVGAFAVFGFSYHYERVKKRW